jgi:hypothetical protein
VECVLVAGDMLKNDLAQPGSRKAEAGKMRLAALMKALTAVTSGWPPASALGPASARLCGDFTQRAVGPTLATTGRCQQLRRDPFARTCILLSIVGVFCILVFGCATGPKYTYVEQKDSAQIEAPVKPVQSTAQYGSCYLKITQIDTFVINFVASRPGSNWLPGGDKPLYLAPGKHALSLDIAQVDEVIGTTGRDVGVVGAYASESRPTLAIVFLANHAYRLTGNLGGSTILISLWDETGGTAARHLVTSWTVDSNRGYSENVAPVR